MNSEMYSEHYHIFIVCLQFRKERILPICRHERTNIAHRTIRIYFQCSRSFNMPLQSSPAGNGDSCVARAPAGNRQGTPPQSGQGMTALKLPSFLCDASILPIKREKVTCRPRTFCRNEVQITHIRTFHARKRKKSPPKGRKE